jgi:hypothetical protein
MEEIRSAIYETLEADNPQTCRGTFYQLVSGGVIPKDERDYKGTVIRLLGEMREVGHVPWEWITDETRWMRKPRSHGSLQDALNATRDSYRRALWNDQNSYVEIWCEKDALAGVLYQETARWDVPLMVARGFSSKTFLHESAKLIEEQRKPAWLYHFGDYDASGQRLANTIKSTLQRYAPWAEIHFEIVAVTPEQIAEWKLPTRPPKKSTHGDWKEQCVEVDAIPAKKLREIARECIERHIDPKILKRTQKIEKAERETLSGILAGLNGGAS